MEFLRNIFSLAWWRELLSNLSFADFSDRMELIRQAIANPQGHPLIALLAFAIILVLILIVMLTIVMIYYARRHAPEKYELLDEEGEVIAEVEKEEAKRFIDPDAEAQVSYKVRYGAILAAIASVLLLVVGFGFGTRTDIYCEACHEAPHNADDRLVDAHQGTTVCVDCHESGSLFQSVTVNLLPRAGHTFRGIMSTGNADAPTNNGTTYGSVANQACGRCHMSDIIEGVVTSESSRLGAIRMSHSQVLDAGMPCADCHIFTENQSRNITAQGMQTCLFCHNGTTAKIDCDYCHKPSPTTASRPEIGDAWARQLIHRPASSFCYDCHDPRPCDACHGTRFPHSEAFMDVADAVNYRLHANEWRRAGRSCLQCHVEGSVSGAAPCSDCHGDAYK